MNRDSKQLPHLNQLFLQKQHYTSHRKKIQQIRKKKPHITTIHDDIKSIYSEISRDRSPPRQSSSSVKKISLKKIPPVILERCSSLKNSMQWMSPLRRQNYQSQMKQNQRIKSRISQSKSDLRKTKLSREYEKFARIKQRLLKYQQNSQSKKTVLKSSNVLVKQASSSQLLKNTVDNNLRMQKNTKNSFVDYKYRIEMRKQSNFSVFVKRAQQIKRQGVQKTQMKGGIDYKMRPLINYTKMQKSIERHTKNHERKFKTQTSIMMGKASYNLQKLRPKMNRRYLSKTEMSP